MAEYMMEGAMKPVPQRPVQSARYVLELGAGSALLSLVALELMHDSLQCLVVTDHDPGTLERARDNYETTLEDLLESTQNEEEQFDCINGLGSVPILFDTVEWGDLKKAVEVARSAADHSSPLLLEETIQASSIGPNHLQKQNPNYDAERNIFDLVLGSDLIYCQSVVRSLFLSVSYFLSPGGGFLLSQSMSYDDATECKIDEMCQSLNLERTILKDTLQKKDASGVRIQQFTWKASGDHEGKAVD